ncbi:hypothetical protein PQE66_gp032 [Bacillus phage PBC2]|uniref:Uncharacterized protein n=1 Tax=Bacillus phage PBC2 TaxID=1675029 RepID=A0A218KBS8_9CAUD|nr:hypothetical protein PQE66_gp032 [Bacillus phage PBC2]AKQ08347.1 hypothetical protein PBC2_032 [Bacillus phage PBC2]
MDINKLDRITMSKEEHDELFEWRNKHKDLVRNFNPVLEKGMILVGDFHKQLFVQDGDKVILTVLDPRNGVPRHVFQWYKSTQIGQTVHSDLDKDMHFEYNNTVLSTYTSIMAYMEYYGSNKEYVDVQERSIEVPKKKKKKSKGKKSFTRIKRKIYKISVPKEPVSTDRREYERHVEKWTVRGHWRQTKNGKVWIKPYIKGEGKEVTPKEYKL